VGTSTADRDPVVCAVEALGLLAVAAGSGNCLLASAARRSSAALEVALTTCAPDEPLDRPIHPLRTIAESENTR
jgi:hypothetical protein